MTDQELRDYLAGIAKILADSRKEQEGDLAEIKRKFEAENQKDWERLKAQQEKNDEQIL